MSVHFTICDLFFDVGSVSVFFGGLGEDHVGVELSIDAVLISAKSCALVQVQRVLGFSILEALLGSLAVLRFAGLFRCCV